MFRKRPIVALSLALAVAWGANANAGDLVVSAAASLTNAFKEVAQGYEKEHAGTKVILNFGASDVLLQQVVKGAPADVFASADQKAMDKAVEEKAVKPASRVDFAANQVVLIVPADSKANITALKDLTRDDVKRIAYGNPASVPVGRYTQGALEAAGLWKEVQAKSVLAQNVRQSLDYVARGEVDAGFVFATDAAIMADKVKVAVRVPSQTPVTYPIAVTTREAAAKEAESFVAYVLSPAGQAILSRYGFQKP
ncbi:molybdate ABC transporter substrate-binding protein [Achromobacter anxifer]|uniref:molybdate ABC transporter substrate-binding protein n=1 Tax=Achromobacter anxifer TaxID=1287737 RepID=UPI0023F7E0A1|nr:molybdate ABC transporter substrate-binding protein [Achromobacter anxifer]MDF8359403.1 molybdate ABC transporter substrate-binding protein [Achromobacter anxifer]